jgi:ubiquinone/menaquinone biosynthesis C-methylase UbiE
MIKKTAGRSRRSNIGSRKESSPSMKEQTFFDDEKHIKQELQQFYNQEAKKYAETRKKFWKDVEYLLEAMKGFEGKKIRILEFGCGSGRFASYLSEHYQGEFEYLGVDISQKLINVTQKEHPHLAFICADISSFIVTQEQEHFDIIVGTSSFQHIPSYKERLFLMKYFYGVLNYDGLLMMINRSFSQRFFKKYWKSVFSSLRRWLLSFGRKSWRDMMIPWTNKGNTSYRYYHLF